MQRILIVGMSGAGKSTLARRLGARWGLPVTHLDNLAMRPGWIKIPEAELTALCTALAATPQWVVDGNYFSQTQALRAQADLIVLLHLPRWRCFGRVLKRYVLHKTHLKRRHDMAAGLDERLSLGYLLWVWRWPRTNLPKWQQALATCPTGKVKVFKSDHAINAWIQQL